MGGQSMSRIALAVVSGVILSAWSFPVSAESPAVVSWPDASAGTAYPFTIAHTSDDATPIADGHVMFDTVICLYSASPEGADTMAPSVAVQFFQETPGTPSGFAWTSPYTLSRGGCMRASRARAVNVARVGEDKVSKGIVVGGVWAQRSPGT